MIKFFRQIRYKLMESGKTSKYLKYAIGEILLVVIGILIALQVNNWNQNRINTNSANVYIENIKKEVAIQIEILKDQYLDRSERKINGLQLAKSYFEKPFFIEDTISFTNEISYGAVFNFGIEKYNQSIYESLLSSGSIGFVDTELRNDILEYYDYYNHASLVSQGQASNYQNLINGLKPFDPQDPKNIGRIDQIRFIEALSTEEFIREVNIELSNGLHSIARVHRIIESGENLIISIDNYLSND
ncbi:MAG: hypothetical protein KJO77_07545 [Bacteroidia bacterium]|nr:hypothetical protein [Bacteroidia bacterium]NND51011.1 hypothetical protein [Flavobacteriaceae bacterium]